MSTVVSSQVFTAGSIASSRFVGFRFSLKINTTVQIVNEILSGRIFPTSSIIRQALYVLITSYSCFCSYSNIFTDANVIPLRLIFKNSLQYCITYTMYPWHQEEVRSNQGGKFRVDTSFNEGKK